MPGARLTIEQRRTIERCYRIGLSQGQIGSIIGKSPATVSRELVRGSSRTRVGFTVPGARSPQSRSARGGGAGYRAVYDAERAHRGSAVRARRPKSWRLDHAPLRDQVWDLLTQMIATLPVELRKSITWDRGTEMAEHARFKVETGVPIYFCDPQAPWQRGTNENTNGLLRQYWPKGADLRELTQTECDDVACGSTPGPARP